MPANAKTSEAALSVLNPCFSNITIFSLLLAEMSPASLLGSLLLSALACQVLSQTAAKCCATKIVVAPKDKQELSGSYKLKSSQSNKPDPNCADGCIYTMGNDEFCFMDVPVAQSADVTCDGQTNPQQPSGKVTTNPPKPSGKVTTKGPGAPFTPIPVPAGATPPPPGAETPPPAGATPPPPGVGTPPPPGATPPPPGATPPPPGATQPPPGAGTTQPPGAGTPPPPGVTAPPSGAGTTQGLAAQATDANNRKQKTENQLAEASALSTELSAVEGKVNAVKTQNTGRRQKRQAIKSTVAPIVNCQGFLDAINAINTAIGVNAATANIAKALMFAKAITNIADLSQITCDDTLLSSITAATTILGTTKVTVNKYKQEKNTELSNINEEIKALNTKLVQAGMSTIGQATTLKVDTIAAGATPPPPGAGTPPPPGATAPPAGAGTPPPPGATAPPTGAGTPPPPGATAPPAGAGTPPPPGATAPPAGAGTPPPPGQVTTRGPNDPGATPPPPGAGTPPPPGATAPPAGAGTPPPPGATAPPAGAGTPQAPGATAPPAGAGTPPPPGATAPPAGAGTPPPPGATAQTAGAGTPPPPGATAPPAGAGTTQSPAARGQEAEKAKNEAVAAKADALETKAAAEDTEKKTAVVEEKINAIINSSGRIKRQAGEPTVPAVPTTCAPFTKLVSEMTAAMNLKTKQGYKTAGAIGTALALVNEANIVCDATALAALQESKTKIVEAKEAIKIEIIKQQINIADAVKAINKAIKAIIKASKELVASGLTAFADPGTPQPEVTAPTLPTEAPTQGAATQGGAGGGGGGITATRGPSNRGQQLINHILAKQKLTF